MLGREVLNSAGCSGSPHTRYAEGVSGQRAEKENASWGILERRGLGEYTQTGKKEPGGVVLSPGLRVSGCLLQQPV